MSFLRWEERSPKSISWICRGHFAAGKEMEQKEKREGKERDGEMREKNTAK